MPAPDLTGASSQEIAVALAMLGPVRLRAVAMALGPLVSQQAAFALHAAANAAPVAVGQAVGEVASRAASGFVQSLLTPKPKG